MDCELTPARRKCLLHDANFLGVLAKIHCIDQATTYVNVSVKTIREFLKNNSYLCVVVTATHDRRRATLQGNIAAG